MNPNNPNEQYEQYLILIARGFTFQQIVKEKGIAKSTLSTTLKIMEAKGLIERKRIGRQLILTIPHAIQNSLLSKSQVPVYRIHDFWLTFKLKDSIGNDTTRLIASRGMRLSGAKPLANHTDSYFILDGYEACLSPSSLQIHLHDLDNLPLEADLHKEATDMMAKLEPILLKLEDRLGIKALRIDKDTLIAKISQLHIALKNHAFAEQINAKGEKLYVYVSGELRVIVDFSHGKHEYEAVNAKHAIGDGQLLGKLTEAVITKQFDYEQVNKILLESSLQIKQLTEQLNVHAPYLSAWKEVANAINEPVKRARAKKAVEELGQHKLFEGSL